MARRGKIEFKDASKNISTKNKVENSTVYQANYISWGLIVSNFISIYLKQFWEVYNNLIILSCLLSTTRHIFLDLFFCLSVYLWVLKVLFYVICLFISNLLQCSCVYLLRWGYHLILNTILMFIFINKMESQF